MSQFITCKEVNSLRELCHLLVPENTPEPDLLAGLLKHWPELSLYTLEDTVVMEREGKTHTFTFPFINIDFFDAANGELGDVDVDFCESCGAAFA